MAGAPALARTSAPSNTPASPVIAVGYKDGPVSVTTTSQHVLASLRLGTGSWVIFAKAWGQDSDLGPVLLDCQLTAGGDFDDSQVAVPDLWQGEISLNVAHKFTSAGSVKLSCNTFGHAVSFHFVKITAIKAGTLTNTGIR
jgi:hypothetical protein